MASDGRIYFTPSDPVASYLGELKKMGVYGKRRGDVINHILGKEIMRLLERGLLTRLPPEAEPTIADEDGED